MWDKVKSWLHEKTAPPVVVEAVAVMVEVMDDNILARRIERAMTAAVEKALYVDGVLIGNSDEIRRRMLAARDAILNGETL